MNKPNLSVFINDLPALRRVAHGLGCTLTTGPRAGEGSIRQMLEYISRGEIVCMFHSFDDAAEMLKHADELREIADELDIQDRQNAAVSLRALAAALWRAAELKED